MARDKTKRSARPGGGSRPLLPGWWSKVTPEVRRMAFRASLHLAMIAALAAAVWYGLRSANQYVRGMDRYKGPIKIAMRIKHRRDDVLVATRELPEVGVPDKARLIYRETDKTTGRLVVEYNGKAVQVAAADVQPQWLSQFDHVPVQLVSQASGVANALPSASAASPDWFDARMTGKVRDAAAKDPYVEKVVQVDKQLVAPGGDGPDYSRQVVLTVVLRRPLAQMWHPPSAARSRERSYAYVLDRAGFVLEKRAEYVPDMPLVVGYSLSAESARRLEPGANLGAADVQAGLELLAKLSTRPFFGDIAEVDVSNYDRRRDPRGSELVFYAKPIQSLPAHPYWWGLRDDNPIEYNNSLEKMQILQNTWAKHGRLNVWDLYPGPLSLYHTRGLPFLIIAERRDHRDRPAEQSSSRL